MVRHFFSFFKIDIFYYNSAIVTPSLKVYINKIVACENICQKVYMVQSAICDDFVKNRNFSRNLFLVSLLGQFFCYNLVAIKSSIQIFIKKMITGGIIYEKVYMFQSAICDSFVKNRNLRKNLCRTYFGYNFVTISRSKKSL